MIDKVEGKTRWVRSTDILAGLALFFSSIFFFYDLLGGRYILTERDLSPYFIPPRFFWVASIKNGHFPLWNPYQFSGHPFFANPQHAILYPLNSLFFILPFDIAFNGIIILHFFLGGLFTYLLLKELKVNSTGALLSGLIFMLSGYLLSVHSLLNTLLSVIWTPLIMMFFRRAILNSGWKNRIWAAIFITISFLGGGIEIVYGNFFVILLMVIFVPLQAECHCETESKQSQRVDCFVIPQSGIPRNDIAKDHVGEPPWGLLKRSIFIRLRSLLIIFTIFLFLSAIQLIPFLELWMHSIRGGGISYNEATTWSLAPKDILLFFLPDAYGYFLDMKKYWINQCWFKTLYTGGLPFILALLFFLFGKDRKLYLSLIIFSLFLSLGKFNPLYTYVYKYIPFFNGLRYPVKFLYIFILVLSVTAGLGFQRLTEYSKEGEAKRLKNILIIFLIVSALFLLFFTISYNTIGQFLKSKGIDFPDFNYLSVNLFHAIRFLFYLTLFFLLLKVGDGVRWKGWAKILLVFFLTTDLFGNMGFYGKEKVSDYFKKTKNLEMISLDKRDFRIFSTPKTTSFDTPILIAAPSYLDIFKEKSLPSLNLIYRLHDIWGIDVIHLKRVDDLYKAFTGAPSIFTTNLLDLYGVKYIVSVTPLGKDPRFELIYGRIEGLQGRRKDLLKENTIKLYKNHKPILRAWLVKDFKVMDDKAILSRMTSKDFRPDKEVLLEEEPQWEEQSIDSAQRNVSKSLPKSSVEFLSENNNRLHLFVRTSQDSLLVLNDTYFRGWKVFVNGREGKIYRANYNFRAIPLKAGGYEVKFIYNPISFKIGIFVSLFTVIGIMVYFIKSKPSQIKISFRDAETSLTFVSPRFMTK